MWYENYAPAIKYAVGSRMRMTANHLLRQLYRNDDGSWCSAPAVYKREFKVLRLIELDCLPARRIEMCRFND